MKRFLTSILVICLMCSMLVPAYALLDPTNIYGDMEDDLEFLPDPNQDVELPKLPNSKTLKFMEENKDHMIYYSQVMPVTFSECTYESFSNPDNGSFEPYTSVTIKTGGSVRADFTRNIMVLHDVIDTTWNNMNSGMGMTNIEDNPHYYTGAKELERFGVVESNANFIGYYLEGGIDERDFVQNVYGKGQTWTFNKPGTYYLRVKDPFTHHMSIKLTVEGKDISNTAGQTQTAKPTPNRVYVNGKDVKFEAYNISGNNYFKLRDIAMAIKGTKKQFDVTWNGSKNAIELVSNKAYTVVGGELTQGDGTEKVLAECKSDIYKDGMAVNLTGYSIGGNNYFKLRDIGKAFNFSVTWDVLSQNVHIDTTKPYTDN